MAEFVTINEDKFEKKITYKTTTSLSIFNFVSWGTGIKLRRVVGVSELDDLLIDIQSHGYNNSRWLALSEGKLIIIADDETITLPANTNYAQRDSSGNADESCYYELGKSNLLKICNSKYVALKLYTGRGSDEAGTSRANEFASYCRLFYNAVYDNTAYKEAVAAEKKKKEKEEANGCLMRVIALVVLVLLVFALVTWFKSV